MAREFLGCRGMRLRTLEILFRRPVSGCRTAGDVLFLVSPARAPRGWRGTGTLVRRGYLANHLSSILANSPPHVLVRSVMRAGTAPSRVPNFPLRRPKAAASMCSSSASSPKSPKRRKLKTLRVWRGERKSRVWIWNRGREPFKKGSLPPPLSFLNFSIVLNPCLRRSHFARGQGVAFFLGSRRAAEQSCSAALHMKRLDTIR